MDYVWRESLEKHPMDLPSAGSVFKNRQRRACMDLYRPGGPSGFCRGGACVSEKHPNFIVNMGGATASDVLSVIEAVKKRVADATGRCP